MTRQAVGDMSIPIQCRPAFCAATSAVPQPQKVSSTSASGSEEISMILSRSFSGYWVGNPIRSPAALCTGPMSSQTEPRGTPLPSSR